MDVFFFKNVNLKEKLGRHPVLDRPPGYRYFKGRILEKKTHPKIKFGCTYLPNMKVIHWRIKVTYNFEERLTKR